MHRDYLSRRRLLLTRDLDEARQAIDPLWERHRAELIVPSGFSLDLRHAPLRQAALMYIEAEGRVRVTCGPVSDGYHLMLPEAGGAEHRIEGRIDRSSPTRAVLHAPGAVLEIHSESYRSLFLSLERDCVDRVLPDWRRPVGGASGDWPTGIDMTVPAAACLTSFCRWLATELDRPRGGLLTTPRAIRNIERTLVALFLDAFGSQLPDPGTSSGLTAAVVRRIEDWMEAHYADPIGVDEMARFAGVSVRSLQLAFRRIYGLTPTAALLACRLRHARLRLQAADMPTTVTQVALDCGFFHLGRFSVQYKRMFGESPSATLRRTIDRRLTRTARRSVDGVRVPPGR